MTNEELKSYFPNMHRHIKEADFNCGVAFENERIMKLFLENFHRFDLSNNQIDNPMSEQEFIELARSGKNNE